MKVLPAALILSALLLAGCGQKGDLYLPEQGKTPQTEQATTNQDTP